MQTCECDRCGVKIELIGPRNEKAFPFRRAKIAAGVCANCVVTQFLYNTYPVNMIIDESGPDLLLKQGIGDAFVMSGLMDHSDLEIGEVDWKLVVKNWYLPVEVKSSPKNPYRMGESPRSHLKKALQPSHESTIAEEAEAYMQRMKASGLEPMGNRETIIYGDPSGPVRIPETWTATKPIDKHLLEQILIDQIRAYPGRIVGPEEEDRGEPGFFTRKN